MHGPYSSFYMSWQCLTFPSFQRYMAEHAQEDYLLTGFHGKNQNPFREKSSCSVI